MTVHGCFGLGIARVKALGALKKERKKKTKMTKHDFHVSRFVTLVTTSINLFATVRWGNAREQI